MVTFPGAPEFLSELPSKPRSNFRLLSRLSKSERRRSEWGQPQRTQTDGCDVRGSGWCELEPWTFS